VSSRLVIDIQPHRYGWTCAQAQRAGEERVFILKSQAIQYAQQQCAFLSAEIRIRDRRGEIERCLEIDPHSQAMSA
jgi:hypothetical protein